MITEIYLVRQEKRCGFLDNRDFSFIHFDRAFSKKKDAELYLYQLKQNLINDGYKPYHDLDQALFQDSIVPSFCFQMRDKFVKLTIKQIYLI